MDASTRCIPAFHRLRCANCHAPPAARRRDRPCFPDACMHDGIPWECPEEEYLRRLRDRQVRNHRAVLAMEANCYLSAASSSSRPPPQPRPRAAHPFGPVSDVWEQMYAVHGASGAGDGDTDMSVEEGPVAGGEPLPCEEGADEEDDLDSLPDWSEAQMRSMEAQMEAYRQTMATRRGALATVEEHDGGDEREQPPPPEQPPGAAMLGSYRVTRADGSAGL